MKVLLLILLSVLGVNVFAVDCSVNELVKTPMNIVLPTRYELCLVAQRGDKADKEFKCVGQNGLNYSTIDIQAQKQNTCGYKGSELQIENEAVTGTFIACENGTGLNAQNLQSLCLNTKSKDGKYMLKMCTDINIQTVVTLAVPVKQKRGESKYLLMVNPVGNEHVTHVNEITCGDKRTKSPLSNRPFPRDLKKEQGI